MLILPFSMCTLFLILLYCLFVFFNLWCTHRHTCKFRHTHTRHTQQIYPCPFSHALSQTELSLFLTVSSSCLWPSPPSAKKEVNIIESMKINQSGTKKPVKHNELSQTFISCDPGWSLSYEGVNKLPVVQLNCVPKGKITAGVKKKLLSTTLEFQQQYVFSPVLLAGLNSPSPSHGVDCGLNNLR